MTAQFVAAYDNLVLPDDVSECCRHILQPTLKCDINVTTAPAAINSILNTENAAVYEHAPHSPVTV